MTHAELVEKMNRKFGEGNWRTSSEIDTETGEGFIAAKATAEIHTRASSEKPFTLMFRDIGLVSVRSKDETSFKSLERAADKALEKAFFRAASRFGGELSIAWEGPAPFTETATVRVSPPPAPAPGARERGTDGVDGLDERTLQSLKVNGKCLGKDGKGCGNKLGFNPANGELYSVCYQCNTGAGSLTARRTKVCPDCGGGKQLGYDLCADCFKRNGVKTAADVAARGGK